MQAVLERDPHYVVRRFESGRYAVDSSVRQIYQQALEVCGNGLEYASHLKWPEDVVYDI